MTPVRQCPPSCGAGGCGGGQLETGLQLLGLLEIVLHALHQIGADQLDDALITLGVLALVDGEGQIAAAEQARQARIGRQGRHRLGVELGVAAHAAGRR